MRHLHKLLIFLFCFSLVAVSHAQEPEVGGEITMAAPVPPSLLPQQARSNAAFLMNATLVTVDPTTNSVVPYLAESWEAADDGLSWTFTLREDVTFHNGDPLTANDYVFTFEWLSNPENRPFGPVPGWQSVAGVEALDDYTLRFDLPRPDSGLLYWLSQPATAPLPSSAVEAAGADFASNPVGTGPYQLVEFEALQEVVLERNPDFAWGPAHTHGGAPYIERVVMRAIADTQVIASGLETGELDIATIATSDVSRFEGNPDVNVTAYDATAASPVLFINHRVSPLNDVRVRQALNYAVDRPVLIELTAQGFGSTQHGLTTTATIGYNEALESLGYTYDPERAAELLDDAGIVDSDGDAIREFDGEPFSLELIVSGPLQNVRLAELLQVMYAEVGIELVLQQLEFQAADERLVTGNYALTINGALAGHPSLLFHTMHSEGIFGPWIGYSNPEADALALAMTTTTEPEALETALNDAMTLLVEDAIYVMLFNRQVTAATSARVMGSMANPAVDNFVDLFDAYVVD